MINKNIQLKVRNSEKTWDLLFPKTKALLVQMNNGKTLEETITELLNSIAGKTTLDEVDKKIKEIVGAAPESLDTLQELAMALNNDANFASTVTNLIGQKVDKVEGKQLSTNDFTTELMNKLTKLKVKEDGTADVPEYVHPEQHTADIITQDETHRFVSDKEKSTWESKSKIYLGKEIDAPADVDILFEEV